MLKRILATLLLTALVSLSAFAAAEPTFAERLGWKPDDRVVIFHIDDGGMSHSSNMGSIEALEKGVATSVSTMMPCGWVPEFAAWLKENPDVDNGIHLTLTAEWKNYRWPPLAGRDVVPGLIDEEGCMWHEVAQVVEHATPEEVETEIRAQIERAEKMGIPITHIDSHMGTLFADEGFFMAWIKVAIEKQIPMLLPGGHMTYITDYSSALATDLKEKGIPELVWAAGLPVIDDIATSVKGNRPRDEMALDLIDMLKTMKPGITEIIVHCTRPTDNFSNISASGGKRLAELETMLDPRVKQCIEDEGIILTTWRELKERRDTVGATASAE